MRDGVLEGYSLVGAWYGLFDVVISCVRFPSFWFGIGVERWEIFPYEASIAPKNTAAWELYGVIVVFTSRNDAMMIYQQNDAVFTASVPASSLRVLNSY